VAAAWLVGTNQRIQEDKVYSYAQAMLAGEWHERRERERIVFRDGRLRNGHHRLHAVIRSGVTIHLRPYGDPPCPA
jgi:hypothetical protein